MLFFINKSWKILCLFTVISFGANIKIGFPVAIASEHREIESPVTIIISEWDKKPK